MKRSWLNLLSWASLAVVVGPAWAVKPEFWTHEQPSDFTAAELDNIVITNQGEVRLGRKSETLHAPGQEAEVINAIARAGDGKIYAASGPRGIIYRIDGDKVTQFATLPDGGTIFSLLFAQDGKLLAGTGGGPQARIHLIDGNGKVSLFYEPPGARYIWSMVRGPAGEIYVATGVEGKLFVVNADGTNGRLLADLKPKSLLCLAFGPDGSLYGGTDEDGLVYRINPASGKWYVLYDAKEPEISALVVDAAGNVYAATASAEAARPGRTVADTPGGKPDHSASAPATRPASDTAPGTAPGTNPGQPPASGTGADDEDDDEKEAKQAIMQAMGMPKNLGRAVPAGPSPEGGNAIYRIDIDGFVTEVFREPVMIRNDAIKVIAAVLGEEAVVANIGVPSKELYAARDRDLNFYMLGSYTQATPIGLGLALGTDRDVVVLDGDGSLLGTAVLPVVAAEAPANLTIVCLDNGAFGSTGNQLTNAYGQVDMELLARAAGIRRTCKVQDEQELRDAWEDRGRGPTFIHVVLKPGNATVPNIPLAPAGIRERFGRALRG